MSRKNSSKVFSEEANDETKRLLPVATTELDNERENEDNCLFSWLLNLFSRKPHKSLDTCPLDDFPFDDRGNLRVELKGYKEIRNSEFKYIDIQSGNRQMVKPENAHKLKIEFNYDLRDKFKEIVKDNKKLDSKRSPETQDLYGCEFGQGFVEGILGMRRGGIRRIIVPPLPPGQLTLLQEQDYAVLDVELLQVRPFPDAPSVDNEHIFGEFPFHKGKLKEQYVDDHYENVKTVKYRNAFVPEHSHDKIPDGDISTLKVAFNCKLWNESEKLYYESSKRKPTVKDLCEHNFGKGFEEGIQGMKQGGIRRIIVPISKEEQNVKGLIFYKKGDYAVFDVELLEFGRSCMCVRRDKIVRNKLPGCFCSPQ